MLVVLHGIVERVRVPVGAAMRALLGARMKMGTWIVLAALVAASGCGGGGEEAATGGGGSNVAAEFIADQFSPGANTVSMAQGTRSGDTVTVRVNVTDTNSVFGVAFDLTFDDSNVSYVGFAHGTALESGGNTPNYTVDGTTQAGRVIVGVSRAGTTATNVAGTKTVLNLTFRVRELGTFPVGMENAVVSDAQPVPQPLPGMSWFAGVLQGA